MCATWAELPIEMLGFVHVGMHADQHNKSCLWSYLQNTNERERETTNTQQ
jgi:hypothetical protein